MSQSGSTSTTQQQKLGKYGSKRNAFSTSPFSTGYSSANHGNVTIDPSIRKIQDQGLARTRAMMGELDQGGQEIMGNLRNTRSRFEGNQSAYMQSRINPFEQEYNKREGGLRESLGLRNVSGSSFGDQSMDSFATEKQRGIGDVRAQAEMENLQALTGIDSQMAQTLFQKAAQMLNITGMDNETANARFTQELSALGLGKDQINMMSDYFEKWQQRELDRKINRTSDVSYGGGSSGGSSPSAGSGGSGGGCFVAEVLYGVNSDKTLTIRAYVGRHANDRTTLGAFFRLYIKYGKKWADTIDAVEFIKPIARIVWDKFHRMAISEKK